MKFQEEKKYSKRISLAFLLLLGALPYAFSFEGEQNKRIPEKTTFKFPGNFFNQKVSSLPSFLQKNPWRNPKKSFLMAFQNRFNNQKENEENELEEEDSGLLDTQKAREIITPYFDESFYQETYLEDLSSTDLSPLDHFLTQGWQNNNQPAPWFNTELYTKYFPSHGNPFVDWLTQPSGVTSKKRKQEIIITMTSYPPRMETTWLAIESLLRQTVKPDRIILNLFEGEFPERALPKNIEILLGRGLEINWCPENLKVFLKLIPSLLRFPDSTLVCFDDDMVYPKDRLGKLVLSSFMHPHSIVSTTARIMEFSEKGILLPVKEWAFTGFTRTYPPGSTFSFDPYKIVPEGVGGCLIPPNCLNSKVLDKNIFLNATPNDDDIWLYSAATLNNTEIYVLEPSEKSGSAILGTQENGLYQENFRDDFAKLNKACWKTLFCLKIDKHRGFEIFDQDDQSFGPLAPEEMSDLQELNQSLQSQNNLDKEESKNI